MFLSPSLLDAVRRHARDCAPKGLYSFYLYDTTPMREKIRCLKTLMPRGVEIYYAMKANPHAAFLKAAREAGAKGIEIASLGEGKKAVAAGWKADDILFTGPGKSPEEHAWSVEQGIHALHLDSLYEAHRLNAVAAKASRKQDVLLRVNPNFHMHGAQACFSGEASKLGVDEARLHKILPEILALPHLRFRGLHVYAASGVLKVEDLLENCKLVFKMAKEVEAKFPHVRCDVIDFGGGFGIDYLETGMDFSPEAYAKGLQKLIDAFGFADRAFVLELGRYLAADSGWYCTKIVDIKDSSGKKQIICQGGAHHFRRPTALNINHPLVIVPMGVPPLFAGQEWVNDEMAFIGGSLCNTADKLTAKPVHLQEARIGDIVVLGLAGAYGLTMSHIDFLGHPHPPEIVLS